MLGKHIIRQFLIQILGLFLGFFTSIITTRVLGPSGRGDFALILNTATFLNMVIGFSLGPGIVHYIATNKAPLRSIINTVVSIVLALIFLCIIFLMVFPFEKFSFLLPDTDQKYFNEILILLLFINIQLTILFTSILSGKQLFTPQQKSYFITVPITIVAYITIYYVNQESLIDFKSFMIFYIIMNSIPVFIYFITYIKNTRPEFDFTFLQKKQFQHILNFSTIAYVAGIFQFLSYRMDFWFIQYYCGSRELGIYSLSVNLAQMLWLLPQAVAAILMSYSGNSNEKEAIEQTNRLLRITSVSLVLIAIFCELTIGFFIPLLYGNEFEDSIFTFRLLLIGIAPFGITTILSSYFSGKGTVKINLYSGILGFIVCLVLDLLLIPGYGMNGAAVATICSYIFSTAFSVAIYAQQSKTPIARLLFFTKDDFFMLKEKLNSKFLFSKK